MISSNVFTAPMNCGTPGGLSFRLKIQRTGWPHNYAFLGYDASRLILYTYFRYKYFLMLLICQTHIRFRPLHFVTLFNRKMQIELISSWLSHIWWPCSHCCVLYLLEINFFCTATSSDFSQLLSNFK